MAGNDAEELLIAQDYVRLLKCSAPGWIGLSPDARFLLWRLLRVKGYSRFPVINSKELQKSLTYPRSPYARARQELIQAGILEVTSERSDHGRFNFYQLRHSHLNSWIRNSKAKFSNSEFKENSINSANEEIAAKRLLKLDEWLIKNFPFQNFSEKKRSSQSRQLTLSARLLLLTLYGISNEFGKIDLGKTKLAKISGLSEAQVEYNLKNFLAQGFVLSHTSGNTSMPFFGKVPGLICMNICVYEIFEEISYSCVVVENRMFSQEDSGWSSLNKMAMENLQKWRQKKELEIFEKNPNETGFMDNSEFQIEWKYIRLMTEKNPLNFLISCQKAVKQCLDTDPEIVFESSMAQGNFFTSTEDPSSIQFNSKNHSFIRWICKNVFLSGTALQFSKTTNMCRHLLDLVIYRRTSDFLTNDRDFQEKLPTAQFSLLSSCPTSSQLNRDIQKISEEERTELKAMYMRKILWTYVSLAAKANERYLIDIFSSVQEKYFGNQSFQPDLIDLVPMRTINFPYLPAIDRYRVCIIFNPITIKNYFYLRFEMTSDIKQRRPKLILKINILSDFANFQEWMPRYDI